MKPFNRVLSQPDPIPFEDFASAMNPFGPREAPDVELKLVVSILTIQGEAAVQTARRELCELRKLSPEVVKCVGVEDAWSKV